MKLVVVVTGYELGWDNVVGVFPYEQLDALRKRFPDNRYNVDVHTVDSVEDWD